MDCLLGCPPEVTTDSACVRACQCHGMCFLCIHGMGWGFVSIVVGYVHVWYLNAQYKHPPKGDVTCQLFGVTVVPMIGAFKGDGPGRIKLWLQANSNCRKGFNSPHFVPLSIISLPVFDSIKVSG